MSTKRLIRAIHGARSAAGLDEETFRDRLESRYGTRHLSALDGGQLRDELTSLNGGTDRQRRQLNGPYASKLQALWLSGFNLGIVRDRRDEALLRFVERQTGIQRTEFLRDAEDARKAVEALKSWLEREGGVDWTTARYRHDFENNPRFQVVHAQVHKLVALGRFSTYNIIRNAVGGTDLDKVSPQKWTDLQAEFGEMIRGAK